MARLLLSETSTGQLYVCGDGQHMAADVHAALKHVAMQELGTLLGFGFGFGLGLGLGSGLALGLTLTLTLTLTTLTLTLTLPLPLPLTLTLTLTLPLPLTRTCVSGLSAEAAEAKLAALAKAGRIQREIWH